MGKINGEGNTKKNYKYFMFVFVKAKHNNMKQAKYFNATTNVQLRSEINMSTSINRNL